jgi:hypothetical protein
MSTWHTSSPPKAQLTPVDPSTFVQALPPAGMSDEAHFTPDKSGIITRSGNTIHYYRTMNGVQFARVVDPHGFVLWLQEVP